MTTALRPPSSGPLREALREKGQFFTPDWLAEAMVAYASVHATTLYDVGFGTGVFAAAAIRQGVVPGSVSYRGCETDPTALARAAASGIPAVILNAVATVDFLQVRELPPGTSLISNPPYVRHHRLPPERKLALAALATRLTGAPLDGRAGLHAFFLLHALSLLPKGQRLAFVLPADICEGVYSSALWRWLSARYRINGIVTFSPDATPFPGVDTNAVVLLLEHAPPREEYPLVRVDQPENTLLLRWIGAGCPLDGAEGLQCAAKSVASASRDGFSRFPLSGRVEGAPTLGNLFRCMRGIATGANHFFCFTSHTLAEAGLQGSPAVRMIGRTRDVPGEVVDDRLLEELDDSGRPTFLLSLSGEPGTLSPQLAAHLRSGEEAGLPEGALIRQRRPWYKMEMRLPPPFLFAYLGRRNIRFIRNRAGVVPLTSFLCVYPRIAGSEEHLSRLYALLNHELVALGIGAVGKSYGGGAIKVEPRALERAPLMPELFSEFGWLADALASAGGGHSPQAALDL